MILGYNQANAMRRSRVLQDLANCETCGFGLLELRLDMLWGHLAGEDVRELAARFAHSPVRPGALNGMVSHIPFLTAARKHRDHPALAEFRRACRTARALGVEDVIAVPPMHDGPYTRPLELPDGEAAAHCVEALAVMADIAAQYGVWEDLEPVGAPKSGVRTLEAARAIVEASGRPNLGLVPDAANLYMFHKLRDFSALAALPARLVRMVHLNDFDDVPESAFDRRHRCFPGEGVIDLGGFLEAVRACGYRGTVSVETLRPAYWARDPEWVARTAYQTARDCLARHNCL